MEKIKAFMRELSLRWFGHVERKDDGRIPVKAKCLVVNGSKKGRLKRRRKGVEKDLLVRGLRKTNVQNRFLWKLGCKNRLIPVSWKDEPSSKIKIFFNTSGTNG